MTPEPSIRLLAGPTASGKSALALRWAEGEGFEIVNADSQQLYRDLRVLTARPSASEEGRAPHHLYGVADAAEAWSVGRWLRAALPLLRAIEGRGGRALVVGGTGLYFRALTHGLAETPPVGPEILQAAGAEFQSLGEPAFRRALAERDPAAAARIAPGDRQRLLRAWAVAEATGRALSEWQADTRPPLEPHEWRGFVLEPPRAELYGRIDARVRAMVEQGALEEVQALAARRLSPDLPAMKAVGVRPFAAHLRGELPLEAAIDQVATDTRQYAKRQMTWFRRQTPAWERL